MTELKTEDGQLVCVLPERADTVACTALQDELLARIEKEGLPVTFDMRGVTYVASSFLRICLLVAKKVGTDNFLLSGISPDVKKVFKMAGLDDQMQMD